MDRGALIAEFMLLATTGRQLHLLTSGRTTESPIADVGLR